jgi:hypothetical protein
MTQLLRVKVVHLKRRMVHMLGAIRRHEERVVVDGIVTTVDM